MPSRRTALTSKKGRNHLGRVSGAAAVAAWRLTPDSATSNGLKRHQDQGRPGARPEAPDRIVARAGLVPEHFAQCTHKHAKCVTGVGDLAHLVMARAARVIG